MADKNSEKVHPIRTDRSLLNRAIRDDEAAINLMFRQFIHKDEPIISSTYLGKMGTSFTSGNIPTDLGALIVWICELVFTLTIGVFMRSHCFGLVTNKRVATIQTGPFGEVIYVDTLHEYINSAVLVQPSYSAVYIWYGIILIHLMAYMILLIFFRDKAVQADIFLLYQWILGFLFNLNVPSLHHIFNDMYEWAFPLNLQTFSDTTTNLIPSKKMVFLELTIHLFFTYLFAQYVRFVYSVFKKSGIMFVAKRSLPVPMFTDRKRMYKANKIYRVLTEMKEARRHLASF